MLIFTVVLIICIVSAAVYMQINRRAAVRKKSAQADLLLHNIEVYNGTPQGQIKMEDKG